MKRTLSAIALLALLAAPAMAQDTPADTTTTDVYGTPGTTTDVDRTTTADPATGTTTTTTTTPTYQSPATPTYQSPHTTSDPSPSRTYQSETSTTTGSRVSDDESALPATAGPLPLLATLGLAAVGVGAWMMRRRGRR